MDAVAVAVSRISSLRRLAGARVPPLALAPVPVVIALFKLAISDGGRHAGAIAFAQVAIAATAAYLLVSGAFRPTAVGTATAAMAGVAAVTILWSVRPDASVRQVLLWLLYLGIAGSAASTLRSWRAVSWFADALVVTAGWLCLVGLFTFWGAGTPGMRWYSTFYWPNPFAAFLLLALPIEVVRCVHASRRHAFTHGILSLLLAVSLALTYSRGAWLSLVLAAPVAAVVLRPPSWPQAVGRILVLAVAVAAVALVLTRGAGAAPGEGLLNRAASITDATDFSLQGRLNFWRSAWAIFRDHPLGTGAGTFGAVHAAYQRDVRYYSTDAHNLYLQTAAEMGVPGLIALAAMLGTAGGLWVRALRRARGTEWHPVVAGSGIALLAFFVHSGIEMNWMFPADPAMAFALIGMLAASDRAMAGDVGRPGSRRFRLGGVLVCCCAAAAAGLGWAAQQEYVRGLELARAGNWRDAAQAYGRALRWNPLQSRYLAARAAALMQTSPPQPEAAEAALRRAMALDPMNASHPLALAAMLALRPDWTARTVDIDALLRGAIALDPVNRPESYRLLARLYRDEGRVDDAGRVLRDAVTLYRRRGLARGMAAMVLWPEVAGLTRDWAAWLLSQGRAEEAAAVLTGVLEDDPTWIPAYLDLAAAYVRQGRDADARRTLAQGLDRAPAHEELWIRWQLLQSPRPARFPL